jgi:hypothetical protein
MKSSREFIIDRKVLRSWVAMKGKLKKTPLKATRNRRQYSGARVVHPEMEKQLYAWIKDNRLRGACVGGREIKAKARALLNEDSGFQASSGWLAGFLRRRKLSLRRITSTGYANVINWISQI